MAYTAKQLLSLIRQIPETDCWEFKGKLDRSGYGWMYVDNKEQKAHRFFFEACEGQIPDGVYLRHCLPTDKCIGHGQGWHRPVLVGGITWWVR